MAVLVTKPEARRRRALALVWVERTHQECMKAKGRFRFTCADVGPECLTDTERLAILIEEVGEVAREVLTAESRRLCRDTIGTRETLRDELVQVAAVAVAWLEALEALDELEEGEEQ